MESSPSWPSHLVEEMDPSIFLQYSPQNGLPQESKLATYMNRTSTPTRSINQSMGKLSLESSPTAAKKVVIGEFVPMNYYSPAANMLPDSADSSPPTNLPNVPPNTPHVHQENVGGTTYFYSTNADNNTGLNNSASMAGPEPCLGAGVPPCAPPPNAFATQMYPAMPGGMGPNQSGLAASFYMPETIRAEIYQRNEDMYLQNELPPYPDLPGDVEMYSELTPLEGLAPHQMASCYRVTHRQTGEHFAMRRLHAYSAIITKRAEMWKLIDHPNIIRLHDIFTTAAFGDHSLVMVYDYHPSAVTLMNKYLTGGAAIAEGNGVYHDPFSSDPDAPRPYSHQKNAMLRAVASGALLPEAVLWSLLVQLSAALRTIHNAGLACRSLDPSKVVMNGCRVRISWCGIPDALMTNVSDLMQAQQEDLAALGRLALTLACRNLHCENIAASLEIVARTYSPDFHNLLMYLLSATTNRRSVADVMPMIGTRFYTQVEALERRADAFEEQLAREIDNGRLLRILIKLGVVNERPELNLDAAWSETGDRYMLKLFRDYLFHAVTEDGRPWVDFTHLTHCLNQLDGGSSAKVELMSRDEQSVLVVSYAELKHCLEQAFDEVMQATAAAP